MGDARLVANLKFDYSEPGITISVLEMPRLIQELVSLLRNGRGATAYGLHVGNLNAAIKDRKYRQILRRGTVCYADGYAVRVVCAAWRQPVPARVATTDLIWPLLREAASAEARIYFLGGSPGEAKAAAARAASEIAGLNVVGTRHGFFDPVEADTVAEEIAGEKPDLLLVGLGVPREQVFCDQVGYKTNSRLLLTVGGLYRFMSGLEVRAPLWAQDRGLEWLWRTWQDPRRKGPRYVTGFATTAELAMRGLTSRLWSHRARARLPK